MDRWTKISWTNGLVVLGTTCTDGSSALGMTWAHLGRLDITWSDLSVLQGALVGIEWSIDRSPRESS